MSFQRIVERLLIAPRGRKPRIVERLRCGHEHSLGVSYPWVQKKQFPTDVAKVRERHCLYCSEEWKKLGPEPHQVRESFEPRDIVLKASYNILSDIAMAVWLAEQEDLKNAGGGSLDSGV